MQHSTYTRRDTGAAPAGWTPGRADSRLVQAASSAPRSYDKTNRTVQAVLATGYRVRRWFGWEELAIDSSAIDLTRVSLGQCRLLDSHNQFGTDKALGVITAARVERGELMGTIKFNDSPAGREAERLVSTGECTGISVGYRISRLVRIADDNSDDEVYRAEQWELLEASLVSVPADPYAGARSLAPFTMRPGSRLTPADAARMRMSMASALIAGPLSPADAARARMRMAQASLMRPRR